MFDLRIAVTSDALEAIKADLTHFFPHVKSSHRCEALARALGFRTYAGARVAACGENLCAVQVSGERFTAYLTQHGFEVTPQLLYVAAAKAALRDVAAKVPQLTVGGMDRGLPQCKPDGEWETDADIFSALRADLVSNLAAQPFLASLALLAEVSPTKTVRPSAGSYHLKHVAEQYACTYPEGEKLGPVYVPNGVFIAAALHLGFKIKTHINHFGDLSPNVSFNISVKNLDDLDYRTRGDGARTEWAAAG